MNGTITITEKDELIMKLVHYFVTKENYSPILVNGVKNEVWLENLDAYYKIIRINSNYIHNNEQYEFDIYKINNVCKQIGKKTLTRKLRTLNILTDTNDVLKVENSKNIDNYIVKTNRDLENKNGLLSMFPLINEEEIKDLHGLDFLLNVSNDINKKTEKENKFYENVFKPKKIVVTKALIIINVIIFILSMFMSNNIKQIVFTKFALYGMYIKHFELYRLVTYGFLHANVLHLACNMYSLSVIGSQMESYIGKIRFLIVYFISLITGGLLACVISNAWIVGASGAIFGLIGSLIYFGYHYRIYLGSVIKTQIIPLLIINLVLGMSISSISLSGHIGGLVGGLLTTMAVGIEKKSTKSEMINGLICLVILILFLFYLLFKMT